jgi:cytochrome b6-f complex iron-sulfur subunit
MINESTIQEVLAVDQNEPRDEITRRSFLGIGAGAVGLVYVGAIGYPVYKYLATPAQRSAEAGKITETALEGADKIPVNSALMFKFGTKPAMLIRHSETEYAAFNAVCTHLGCTVSYEPENSRIHCACHGGVYNPKTGANVSGPPPKPLTQYKVEVFDGRVVVAKA